MVLNQAYLRGFFILVENPAKWIRLNWGKNKKRKFLLPRNRRSSPRCKYENKTLPPLNSTECQLFPSQNCDSDPDPSESIWERKLRAGSCWHANGRGGSQRKECISKADGHHEIANTNKNQYEIQIQIVTISDSEQLWEWLFELPLSIAVKTYLKLTSIRKIATLEPFGLQLD